MATIGQVGTATVLAASLTFSGLVFTGTTDINDIKNLGAKWKQDITDVVNNTIGMKSNADAMKQDAIAKINAKSLKINELNALIQDLYNQVGTGTGNLEDSQNEINRLESELQKANDEIASLKQQFGVLDSEIQTVKSTSADASDVSTSVDGTVTETATPTGPSTTDSGTTTDTGSTTTTNDYATEESSLQTAIMNNWGGLSPVTAEITDTTVTLTGSNVTANMPNDYISFINSATGKTATYSTNTATSYTYTLQ